MRDRLAAFTLVSGLWLCLVGAAGCGGIAADGAGEDGAELGTSWEALMADGDASTLAPGPTIPPLSPEQPAADCADCDAQPLAFWTLDDCNAQSTQLQDSAFSSQTSHPAFRAVSAACTEGASGQGVRLAGKEDVVYAPDQPDFNFARGLTVAAFIKPDRLRGTQSIVRKRFDDSSSFVLALENRQLSFVVRLDNGRLAGVSAPIETGHFSHVAATFDGRQVRLYVDGALAGRARANGKIARGAGPIFIGNDADGRQFKGVVDEIWLDDRAASAETIAGLRCIHRPPTLSLQPLESTPQTAGDSVQYDLSITNQNDASCPNADFFYYLGLPFGLSSDVYGSVSAAPGETVHADVDVRSSKSAAAGSYPFEVYVYDESSYQASAFTEATFVIGTGPVSCDSVPPYTPLITGSPDGSAPGFITTYQAPGITAPEVTQLVSPQGVFQGLRVVAQPGVPELPENDWFGVTLGLNPYCIDASAYSGVQFTIAGDLGTCRLAFEAVTAQDNQVAFGGACTETICYGPLSGPVGTGTTYVRFADMAGGVPMDTVDASSLQAVQWAMNTALPGSAPCVADFTITDVRFVGEHALSYGFEMDAQGWTLSDWDDPNNTAVHVPVGGTPPNLGFSSGDGDPSPGALLLTGNFSAGGQYVDAIINRESADLSGKALHARVKWVAGSLPSGTVQLHASSLPDFSWFGSDLDASSLATLEWVSLTLDLSSAPPGFDASQIAQVGVQVVGFDASAGPFVLAIDTVTD